MYIVIVLKLSVFENVKLSNIMPIAKNKSNPTRYLFTIYRET